MTISGPSTAFAPYGEVSLPFFAIYRIPLFWDFVVAILVVVVQVGQSFGQYAEEYYLSIRTLSLEQVPSLKKVPHLKLVSIHNPIELK